MSKVILDIQNLTAKVEEKDILQQINLQIGKGEVHVLMGPNGAGKSTLGYVLMGNPKYKIEEGKILFKNKDITNESVDKRAKDGMFLLFQEPVEVQGLQLDAFLLSAMKKQSDKNISAWKYKQERNDAMELLEMDHTYGERSLNFGFSGGEKKKTEVLQMMLLNPDLAILDETDSGLDVDAVRTVSKGIEEYMKDKEKSLLIITHSTRILDHIHVDYTHIMVKGRIVKTGDESLIKEINENGYEAYISGTDSESVSAIQ